MGVIFYAAYFMIDSPKREMVANLTSAKSSFSMTVRHGPPYHFVLGLPESSPLNFRGELRLMQSTGLVVRIPISSDDVTACNWLHSNPELTGYILTWSRTNISDQLGSILARGQRYDVEVTFSQSPPTN